MVSPAWAVELSGLADCGLEQANINRALKPDSKAVATSISSSVVTLRLIIATGRKAAAASLGTAFFDCLATELAKRS